MFRIREFEDRIANIFKEFAGYECFRIERHITDAATRAKKCDVKVRPYTQQAEPERMVAVRRMRKPTRSDPNAGHMLCG